VSECSYSKTKKDNTSVQQIGVTNMKNIINQDLLIPVRGNRPRNKSMIKLRCTHNSIINLSQEGKSLKAMSPDQ
jgi:hypothetical protein